MVPMEQRALREPQGPKERLVPLVKRAQLERRDLKEIKVRREQMVRMEPMAKIRW
jgi:hypothetical protein